MQAKDLRLGNWLIIHGRPEKVESISYDELLKSNGIDEHYINRSNLKDIRPIPLTAELLEKSGFEINGFKQFDFPIHKYSKLVLDLNGGYIWLRESDIKGESFKDDIVCLWNRDYKKDFYLHQLQNLFYSLSGEELEVKL
jgi:hypothetical protein